MTQDLSTSQCFAINRDFVNVTREELLEAVILQGIQRPNAEWGVEVAAEINIRTSIPLAVDISPAAVGSRVCCHQMNPLARVDRANQRLARCARIQVSIAITTPPVSKIVLLK